MPRVTRLHVVVLAVLITATIGVWQHRFEVGSTLLLETRLADPLAGWTCEPHHQHQVIVQDGAPLLRLQRFDPTEKTPAISVWFGRLPEVKFIHIRCEARWQDVEVGDLSYMQARFVVLMKNDQGEASHPPDGSIFHGSGTRGWREWDKVLEVTGHMADVGFGIAMLGPRGTLEVRNLSLQAVRHRPWVTPAVVALLLGWTLLCASLIRKLQPGLKPWRTAASAVLIVGFSWFTVFPQAKGLSLPIFDRFPLPSQTLPETPPAADPATRAPLEDPPPAPAAEIPADPQAAAVVEPAPVPKSSGLLPEMLRTLKQNFGLLHLALFAAFTLLILLIAGRSSPWPLIVVLAILSELVPFILHRQADYNDLLDLVKNLGGVALGLLFWQLALKSRHIRKPLTLALPGDP